MSDFPGVIHGRMRETARQKYSVTELKKLRMQEESDAAEELYPETDMVPLIPQFIQKTEEKDGSSPEVPSTIQ